MTLDQLKNFTDADVPVIEGSPVGAAQLVPGMTRGGAGEEQSLNREGREGQAGARQPQRPSGLPQN